ncbi:MAG: glycosyltransferase [Candidatus Korobacteraceae bacterium]|jgi:glycosyltransferase involved in cell wall biosynthesis
MIEASQPAKLPVCMFTNATIRAGTEEHMLGLMQRLSRDTFAVCLACPPALLELLGDDLPSDVEAVPVSMLRLSDCRAMARFASFLRDRKIQIVHSHGFRSSLLASPVASWAGVPAVVETPHIREHWRRGWKSNFAIDRLVGRCVGAYIAVSDANRRYLIEKKRLPAEKVHLIRNGCEIEKFDPGYPPQLALKRQLGFADSDPVLLLVGRLEPQKGHSVLLAALKDVLRTFPHARLVCVGEGALRPALEAEIQQLELTSSVRLVGYQSNVQDWLSFADVCVLPSFFEGLPLVAIECLAAGRAMVATAVDGTPEVVIHEETGLTVQAGDAPGLATAIVRLLRDPGLRKRLGTAGRSRVETHFSLSRQIRETEKLYCELWQRRTGMRFAGALPVEESKAAACGASAQFVKGTRA